MNANAWPNPDPAQQFLGIPNRVAPEELARVVDFTQNNPILAFVLQVLKGYILVLNPQRQIILANRELLNILRVNNPYCLLGLRPGEALHCIHATETSGGCGASPSCRNCGAVMAILASQRLQSGIDGECVIQVERDGQIIPLVFKVHAATMTIETQELTIFVLRDISLEKHHELLEETFMHDFSDGLGGIEGWGEILDHTYSQQDAEKIVELAHYLKDELSFHRLLRRAESGELVTSMRSCSPASILATLAAFIDGSPRMRGRVAISSSPTDPVLFTDPSLLLRVLINMVKNAVEALPRNATARVWFEKNKNHIGFFVHNPGMIPSDLQAHIFERHFSTKGIKRGIGSYSMKLFGEHFLHGKVAFSSTNEQGTLFSIVFPLDSWPEQWSSSPMTSPGNQPLSDDQRKVLIVDDDETQSMLSRFLLERLGYEVVTYTDCNLALEVFAANPGAFHFIATDYAMYRIDGIEFSRRLLSIDPRAAILLLTGYDHPAILREAREAGIREVCLKPTTVEEFAEVLQHAGL